VVLALLQVFVQALDFVRSFSVLCMMTVCLLDLRMRVITLGDGSCWNGRTTKLPMVAQQMGFACDHRCRVVVLVHVPVQAF
jgi:hypothetical protein